MLSVFFAVAFYGLSPEAVAIGGVGKKNLVFTWISCDFVVGS